MPNSGSDAVPRFFERGDPAEREQRNLEAKLKGKIEQRDAKGVQLQAAEAALAAARSNVEALALEADEAALDRALQARRSAEDKLAALRGAALAIGKEISEIEVAIDKVVDGRVRVETSAAVDAMADRIAKAQVAHEAAALELESAAKEGGKLIAESVAIFEFTRSAREQLPSAVEMVVAALRAHSRGVLSGHGSPSLPQQPAPPPKLEIVPPMPTVTLFTTKKLKYLDAAGAVIVCGAYHKHTFPQALGELALRTNVAVALNDKRVRDLQAAGFATVGTPDEAACEWLGARGREAPERFAKPGGPPVHSSLTSFTPSGAGPFTVVDRGPPIIGSMPAQPIAVGARKLDTEE
jgi:hypothetical protein